MDIFALQNLQGKESMKILFFIAAFAVAVFTGCSKDSEIKTTESGLKYFDEIVGEGKDAAAKHKHEVAQPDHLQLSAGAVQLVDHRLDLDVVTIRGIRENGVGAGIEFQTGARI